VVAFATKTALRELARRVQHLNAEIKLCRRLLRPLIEQTAPRLLALYGVGVEVAAVLLVAAGDNPSHVCLRAHTEMMRYRWIVRLGSCPAEIGRR
jgi:endonuclease III